MHTHHEQHDSTTGKRLIPRIVALFLTVFGLISAALLGVTYFIATDALDREIRHSLEKSADMAELVIADRFESIHQSLRTMASRPDFQRALAGNDGKSAEKHLYSILESDSGYLIDILFIRKSRQEVWRDAGLSSLLQEDALEKMGTLGTFGEWSVVVLDSQNATQTMVLKAVPVILESSGKILGYLYGGLVLDTNLSLLYAIRAKLRNVDVAFARAGKYLASNVHGDEAQVAVFKRVAELDHQGDLHREGDRIYYDRRIGLFPRDDRLSILLNVEDTPFEGLKHQFLWAISGLIFIALCGGAIAIVMLRRMTRPALNSLVSYAEAVASEQAGDTPFRAGAIREFNQLGEVIENMVHRLKDKQLSLTNAQAIAHLGSWEWNIVSNAVSWSDETFRIFGFDMARHEATFESAIEAIHPDDRTNVQESLSAVLDHGETLSTEHRVVRPDGTVRWVQGRGDVFRNDQGEPIRMVGTVQDITERKLVQDELMRYRENLEQTVEERTAALTKANAQLEEEIEERKVVEERIRTSEARLQSLIENAAEAIVTIDDTSVIQTFNPAAEQIFGYSTAEVVGQNVNMLIPEPFKSRHAGYVEAYLKTGQAKIIGTGRELPALRQDGEQFPAELSVSEFWDGERRMFTGIIRDITERWKTQEALNRAMHEAEAASQAKGRFLANMSHEIRTPMNSVIGYLDLVLEDSGLDKRTHKNLSTASRSAHALLRLINDILDVSKMEAGKLDLEQARFNLPQLLTDILSSFEGSASAKELRLGLRMPPDLPQCYLGDQVRLRQVLVNLIGNSVKFTEQGGITVGVEPYPDGKIHFSIQDTGIGIAESKIEAILEPFAQADAATTRRYGGTGLGTTISRQIVQLMGGEIWIESEFGVGTTFHFTVEMAQSECSATCSEACDEYYDLAPGGTRDASQPGRVFNVLLAEDVEENAELVRIRLEKRGHRFVHVWNGQDAVQAFEDGEFDLILMDVQMPVMDGRDAARQIRALEGDSGAKIPIIALTASVMREETELCLSSGMDKVMGKPVDFPALFALMEEAVPEGKGRLTIGARSGAYAASNGTMPELPGVDVQRGLKQWRVPGAYGDALKRFVQHQADAAKQLAGMLEKGDLDACYRRAHALKGVAGNLAIVRVYELAGRIDAAAKAGDAESTSALLEPLAEALEEVVAGIEMLGDFGAANEAGGVPSRAFDRVQAAGLLETLLEALEHDDPGRAEPVIEELGEIVHGEELERISVALAEFDFDRARTATNGLAEKLGIDLGGK